MPWGTWHDDLPLAHEIISKAPHELEDIRTTYTGFLTNEEKLESMFKWAG